MAVRVISMQVKLAVALARFSQGERLDVRATCRELGISVHRATRRVYFMQVARQHGGQWGLEVADDQCYSCHPSGPRVVRPLDEPRVDQRTLARFNRLILSYGACDFGDSVDASLRFPPEGESGCNRCHNGARRGRLYAIHHRPILFKVEKEETMPPA